MNIALFCCLVLLLHLTNNVFSETLSIQHFTCNRKNLPDILPSELLTIKDINMLMSESERVLLYRELLKVQNYFEYGAGGSTEIACQLPSIQKIVSTDNNFEFLQYLLTNNQSSCIAESISNHRLTMLYMNIGEVGDFGIPVDTQNQTLWPAYPAAIVDAPGARPQLVLIDGRFRVASALYALLVIGPIGKIMFHDFFDRAHYHKILDYTDVIDCVDNFIVLQRKPQIDWSKLLQDIQQYIHDFR